MNLTLTLIIGVLAAWSARSIFQGTRFLGAAGTLTLGVGGSMLGGLISLFAHGAEQLMTFAPMHIWWSTLGAVMLLAGAVVTRRAGQTQTSEADS